MTSKGKARDSEVQAAQAALTRVAERLMPPIHAMMRTVVGKFRSMPEMAKLSRSQQDALIDLVVGRASGADSESEDEG